MRSKKANIMPWHPRSFLDRQGVASIIRNILEVCNTGIVVILSREKCLRKVSRMYVSKGMRMGIPASEAQVNPPNGGPLIVDDDKLVMKLDQRQIQVLRF